MSLFDGFIVFLASAALIGLLALALHLFLRAREKHIADLRAKLYQPLPLEQLSKQPTFEALALDAAEVAAIGAVTYLDVAWHLSAAAPQAWQDFDTQTTLRLANALQDGTDLSTLFDQPIVEHVYDYFQRIEALHVFDGAVDMVWRFPIIDQIEALMASGESVSALESLLDLLPGAALEQIRGSTSGSLDGAADSVIDGAADGSVDGATDALLNSVDGLVDGSNLGNFMSRSFLGRIPYVSIAFAGYRAWRRDQQGTRPLRNLEYALIEVSTRSGGGALGGQLGGSLGTLVMPGAGTLVGSVIGAIGGAISGAWLGEAAKARYVQSAVNRLLKSLDRLGAYLLDDLDAFARLRAVFISYWKTQVQNINQVRAQYRRHATPLRRLWPDPKLILLEETINHAERRLDDVHKVMNDSLGRLNTLQETRDYRRLGIAMWYNPALCEQAQCDPALLSAIDQAYARLRDELSQIDRPVASANALS
ncbi:MAG: hypothetical protein GYB68_19180 [Chloroflexi bacterium]|nr:hypothetical protein [Chloroflexota bacterium]